ncbi:MAG TPA: folylpolyglutamate synthase/dihydrofolate synthase family protein [Anaerolineales bacterium]|nr:folylpolyglutamate synthase/dihydrofolate synthase family protein [Anaerolineales bacterium]
MPQSETAYQAALDYLYGFIDFSLTRDDRYSPERFDLGRVEALMRMLGNPQDRFRILHVAGTKGKGSVSALCASALVSGGYRTGLYTSPHGSEFTERIQVDGEQIPQDTLADLVEELKPAVESIPEITTYEITTALALVYFANQGVEAAVLEVGLGGRLDATNIVLPLVSVITSISYDHTQFLGETLQEIAAEKSGIIKPGVPVVSSPQQEPALLTIEQIANERNAPMLLVGRDYLFAPVSQSMEGQTLVVWPAEEQGLADAFIESGGAINDWEPLRLHIPLLGAHQVENAATAYLALNTARVRGLPVSDSAIQAGFSSVKWPGRFEVLDRHPPVIVDSAHNRHSALRLRQALDDYFPGLPVILIFGASEDKDIRGMFAELLPRVRQVIATRSTHPRAVDPGQLVDLAHQAGKPARAAESVEEALALALRLSESESVVLAAGSVFVAAGVRQVWMEKFIRK